MDESQATDQKYTLTTFGHQPAIQVFLNAGTASSADIARALAPLIRDYLPATGQVCTSPADATPAPTPSS